MIVCDKLLIDNIKNDSLTERQSSIVSGALLMIAQSITIEIDELLSTVDKSLAEG